jgi:hypothetical protein
MSEKNGLLKDSKLKIQWVALQSTRKSITFIGMYYVQNGSFMILVSDLDPMWVRPWSRIELWIRLNRQMR